MLAQSRYVIQAPRQRVWDLLASTIIQCLPVESMQVLNDTTFVGVLNMKIGPITMPVPLTVRAADISPMDSLTTIVTARKGPLEFSLSVSFTLAVAGESSTSVECLASDHGGSALLKPLRWYQRRFSTRIFESIHEGLERSC